MRMPSFRSTVQKHIGTGATTETSKLPLLTAVTSLRYDEAEEKIAENVAKSLNVPIESVEELMTPKAV